VIRDIDEGEIYYSIEKARKMHEKNNKGVM